MLIICSLIFFICHIFQVDLSISGQSLDANFGHIEKFLRFYKKYLKNTLLEMIDWCLIDWLIDWLTDWSLSLCQWSCFYTPFSINGIAHMARSYRSVGSSWAPNAPSFRNHSSKIHHRQLTQVDIEDTYLPSGKIFYWKAILFLECQNNLRKSGFMVNFSGSKVMLWENA